MRVYKRIAQLVTWDPPEGKYQNQKDDEIANIESLLPSGSGFDSGSRVSLSESRADRVVIHTSFHHMDEYGGYCGWSDHDVIITPSLGSDYSLRVTGRNTRDDIKDYIGETFAYSLDQVVPDYTQDAEYHFHTLARVVARFLTKDATWAELKTASREAGYWL